MRKKPPLLKGGGFGFAKTGGILLKLPAEFNGMGLQSLRRRWRHLPLHKGGCSSYFNRMGLTPFRPRCGQLPSRGGNWLGGRRWNTSSGTSCHLPHKGKALPSGLPGNPSFVSLRLTPFAQPQTADPSVCFADISPNRGVSSGKAGYLGGRHLFHVKHSQ